MAGAGLMMRTMVAIGSLDGGFNPHNLISLQVSASGTDYDKPGRRAGLFRELRDRLAAEPGVESVGAINHLPVGGDMWRLGYTVDGRPLPAPGVDQGAVYRVVMPGYIHTMQMGLLQGRDFNDYDNDHSSLVAIINETMARRQWPAGENPIGKIIHYGLGKEDRDAPRTVVGVVRDARQTDWVATPGDEIYLPYFQRPDSMGLSYMTYTLRTSGNPADSLDRIVHDVRAFNKSLPLSEIVTMDGVISAVLWRQRLAAIMMGAFAAVALVLAASGIYGVIAHSMRQRTQEIGIRMALGAKPADLIAMALREGMRPVVTGLAIGFARR